MSYPNIRLCAFKLKSQLPPEQYYVMNFPEEAKSQIRRLTAKRDKKEIDKASLPVISLYKGLRLAPGLIHIGKVSPKPGEFWLYSPHPLPEKTLSAILSYWIDTEFPEEAGKKGKVGITFEERQSAMSFLTPDKLIWEPKTISYTTNFKLYPNETADLSGNDFVLLPHILAAKLSQQEFKVDGEKLHFYRSMTGQGAELISWPPLHPTIGKETYYYSIVLTLKIVQVPGQPYPQFHVTPSIRRWLSSPDSKLSYNHGSNAYIRAKLNWGKGLNPDDLTEYFLSCKLVSKTDWDENLAKLLGKLDILSIEPKEILANPSKALDGKPNIGLTYKDGIKPKHKVGKGFPTVNTHELLSQIAEVLKDSWELINCQRQNYDTDKQPTQFFDFKKPEKSFDEPIVRQNLETDKQFEARHKKELKKQETALKKCVKKKRESESDYQIRREELLKKQELERRSWQPKATETNEDFQLRLEKFYQNLSPQQAKLRQEIRSSIGENLTIWVWYINQKNLDERLKALKYCLGLPEAAEGSYSFPEQGLTVSICVDEVAALAQRLDLSPKSKPNSKEREKAIENKMGEVAEIVKSYQCKLLGKVGVWFELYEKKHWKFVEKPDKDEEGKTKYWLAPWGDPKCAIRLGFAEKGIVSKFITPEKDKSYHQKAISSFIDLLRSLGVRMTPSQITLPNLDKNTPINEVGLWLINRNSETSADGTAQLIPVMVKMSSLTGEIMAIFAGIKQWIPYDEALTRINNDGICFKNDNDGKAKIRTFIQETLKGKELRGKPTILYCQAQNIRLAWTWLQDKEISDEGLSFAERENPVFEQFPELYVIRLRSGNETAEWFGMKQDEVSGFITGLFQNPDNESVFYSIGNKSTTMSGIPKDLSRIEKPEKAWVHPSVVEIAIGYYQKHKKEDDKEGDKEKNKKLLLELAAISHESRHGVLQYEDFLEVPRVLHYAKQMADYVLMLSDDDDESDD